MQDIPPLPQHDADKAPAAAGFAATRWTLVLSAARGTQTPLATAAMAELCGAYWYPLYAFVRRRGHEQHDAEDLTQEFFARLLAPGSLAGVDRQKGRFRSFLLGAMQHFLSDQADRAKAKKRGGGQILLALDGLDAESRYRLEPADEMTPQRLFERAWALSLLAQVLSRLGAEMAAAGKGDAFDVLRGTLTGEKTADYAAMGEKLGMNASAVKVAVHRLRRRYRELLKHEIAQTLTSPEEIEDEIRYLFACL